MIACNATTESITLTLGGSNAHDATATFEEYPIGARQSEGVLKSTMVAPATTAAATVMAAPASGLVRVLRSLYVRNNTAVTTTVTLKKVVSGGSSYVLTPAISLASGESFTLGTNGQVTMYTIAGVVRTS